MPLTTRGSVPLLEVNPNEQTTKDSGPVRKLKGLKNIPRNRSAREIASLFKRWPSHSRYPGIVLDIPYRDFPHEAAAQLSLRNNFAAELFRLGSFPFILATGFWNPNEMGSRLEALLSALRERRPIGEIHRCLLHHSSEELGLLETLDAEGSILFTQDPDCNTIPVLER